MIIDIKVFMMHKYRILQWAVISVLKQERRILILFVSGGDCRGSGCFSGVGILLRVI